MKSRLKQIIAAREQQLGRRITQKEIVEVTGLNPGTVSMWMSQTPITRVDERVILPLCQWLECEIGDIVYIDYNHPQN